MADVENQKKVFQFLCGRLVSQEPFSRAELTAVTNWTGTTPGTYWSKHLKPFVTGAGSGRYRVTEAFRPYANWKRFRNHVTQVRRTASDYTKSEHSDVLIYEFFMPLTNEAALRVTLDELFFKDTILSKLSVCDTMELTGHFPRDAAEHDVGYLDRICEWVGGKFLGYSIGQVNGRFRSEDLATHAAAAEIERTRRYLIDETTAVTRFIFPCEDDDEVERVRWLFDQLFVKSIIQVVNGEDEIWMVESGIRNRLHIWRVIDEE